MPHNPNGVASLNESNQKTVTTPLGLRFFIYLGSQGSREARQPWAMFLNRFAVGADLRTSDLISRPEVYATRLAMPPPDPP